MKNKIIFSLLIFVAALGNAQKISQMPAASALNGTELVPIVQGGVNKAATVSQFTISPASSTTINTGTDNTQFASANSLNGSSYLTQSGSKISAVAIGTNTYTASLTPCITAYSFGQNFLIKFLLANTGASTLNICGLGAISIVKNSNTSLAGGEIFAGQELLLAYDGVNFQIIGANTTLSLTTTGTSGAASLSSGNLNIPQYQGALVSGTNIKTVGGNSLLGSGDVGSIGDSYISSSGNWNNAYTNRITSLTTTGNSGASTLSSNVLNIPNYTLSGLGGISSTLNSGQILIGNVSNVATAVTTSGDATISNAGAIAINWLNGESTYNSQYLQLTDNSAQTLTGTMTTSSGTGAFYDYTHSLTLGGTSIAGHLFGLSPTLVAGANNNTLTCLYLNPTFTNGSFTGVNNWAFNVNNGSIKLNSGFIQLNTLGSTPTTPPSGYANIYLNSSTHLEWLKNDGFTRTIVWSPTASRILTLQDASYTVAGVNLNNNFNSAQSFQSYIELQSTTAPTTPSINNIRIFSNTGNYSWKMPDGFIRGFSSTLTADRTFTWQDASYTIAGVNINNSFSELQNFNSGITLVGSSAPSTPSTNNSVLWSSSGNPSFKLSSGFNLINSATLTADRTITYPDASFTLAGIGLSQTYSGNNTFSGTNNFNIITTQSSAVLHIRAATGQPVQLEDNAGTSFLSISDGAGVQIASGTVFGCGSNASFSGTITSTSSTNAKGGLLAQLTANGTIGLQVRGNGSAGSYTQTGDLTEWQKYDGTTTTTLSKVDKNGNIYAPSFTCNSSTPSVTFGTGAGTSPTTSTLGNNNIIGISITAGSSPATSATIATVTFANSFTCPTSCKVMIATDDSFTAGQLGTLNLYAVGSSTGFIIKSNSVALTASSTYVLNCFPECY